MSGSEPRRPNRPLNMLRKEPVEETCASGTTAAAVRVEVPETEHNQHSCKLRRCSRTKAQHQPIPTAAVRAPSAGDSSIRGRGAIDVSDSSSDWLRDSEGAISSESESESEQASGQSTWLLLMTCCQSREATRQEWLIVAAVIPKKRQQGTDTCNQTTVKVPSSRGPQQAACIATTT